MAFNKQIFYLLVPVILLGCATEQNFFVSYSDTEITYEGRIDTSRIDAAELYWSGTSIKLNFEGESISIQMEDEHGDNYYNIILDDKKPVILRPDSTKKFHELASNLSKGPHSIEIFKRTEWNRGRTSLFGFKIGGEAKILPKSASRNRKIEFYGNSITAGYAVEDFSGKDSPDSTYTNNYLSYAAITARYFDADYHCICKSGIGITVSWFPLIMPEMYNRLIPTDPSSKWNFSLYTPDVVVINLLQNDSWIVQMTDSEEYKRRFSENTPDDEFIINAYEEFVSSIRDEYPESNIICSLGSMDAVKDGSKWKSYIETAVDNLNDEKIQIHFMPFLEAPAHPSIADQETMANSLIGFIEENVVW